MTPEGIEKYTDQRAITRSIARLTKRHAERDAPDPSRWCAMTNACAPEHTTCTHRVKDIWRAKMGMFRTCDVIDEAKARHDAVLVADARTSMCDYRLALSLALGRTPDRNGYSS